MENLGGIKKFANNAFEFKVKKDFITYYHKCCFSPVVSTWVQVIENRSFRTWPELTAHAVRKHLTKSMVTAKGHMQQERKNICSTKNIPKIEEIINENRVNNGMKTGKCYFIIKPIASTGKTFSDKTGPSLVTSSKGNKYVMIMYDYDSNIILGEAMRSRIGEKIL